MSDIMLQPGDIVTMRWSRNHPEHEGPRMIVYDVTGYWASVYCYYSGDPAHGWSDHHGTLLRHIKVSNLIKVSSMKS